MFNNKEIIELIKCVESDLTDMLSKLDTLILLSKKQIIAKKEKKNV